MEGAAEAPPGGQGQGPCSGPQAKETSAFRESAWIRETAHPAAKGQITLLASAAKEAPNASLPEGGGIRVSG